MLDFEKQIKFVAEKIEDYLDNLLQPDDFPSKKLILAMRYSTLKGGKRLRAFLIYYIAKQLNIDERISLNIAACVEMLHSYTLIHDDLPCMDNDDFRRGKLSNHKQFNEYTAVLAGDSLQSEAFYILSSDNINIKPEIKLKLIHAVAKIIGGRNIISGQILDLEFENLSNSEKNINMIKNIHILKTAKFISLCCLLPAIIAEKDQQYQLKLLEYGEKLGIIYQLIDDYQDVQQTSENMNIFYLLNKQQVMLEIDKLDKESREILKK